MNFDSRGKIMTYRSNLAVLQLNLHPGDRIKVATANETSYTIEAQDVIEGILRSRITRNIPEDRADAEAEPISEVVEQATVSSYGHVGIIAAGQTMEVIGIDVTSQERVNFKTTPVKSISYLPDAAE